MQFELEQEKKGGFSNFKFLYLKKRWYSEQQWERLRRKSFSSEWGFWVLVLSSLPLSLFALPLSFFSTLFFFLFLQLSQIVLCTLWKCVMLGECVLFWLRVWVNESEIPNLPLHYSHPIITHTLHTLNTTVTHFIQRFHLIRCSNIIQTIKYKFKW